MNRAVESSLSSQATIMCSIRVNVEKTLHLRDYKHSLTRWFQLLGLCPRHPLELYPSTSLVDTCY